VELPLSDVTVLDLGQVYGGPYCSHLLRHLGARVIKIEPPHHGEPLRGRGRTYSDAGPVNFQLLNGGKESVTLDLKAAQDRDTFLQLCDSADVIVENFAPGTMDRLGLDYASVMERNPAIVYASLKAYSVDSPSRDARGMDLTVQASSGIMSVNGFPDAPPVKCGPSLVDFLGGTHLALGVLAALMERRTTRRGQQVRVSLQDSVIPTMASNIAGWLTNPMAPLRTGNHHGGMAECPYNSYATNDGYVAILCLTGVQWADLCDVMQRPDLRADATLVSSQARSARMVEIDAAVAQWTIRHSSAELEYILRSVGVPASRVQDLEDLMRDEAGRTEPMVRTGVGTDGLPHYAFGSPVRLGNHTARQLLPSPALAQDNANVLDPLTTTSTATGGTT